jgi:hypothetical protein
MEVPTKIAPDQLRGTRVTNLAGLGYQVLKSRLPPAASDSPDNKSDHFRSGHHKAPLLNLDRSIHSKAQDRECNSAKYFGPQPQKSPSANRSIKL